MTNPAVSLTSDHASAVVDGALVLLHPETGFFCVFDNFDASSWAVVSAGGLLGSVLDQLAAFHGDAEAKRLIDELVTLGFVELL